MITPSNELAIDDINEINESVEKTIDLNNHLKSGSANYSTSWIGWDIESLDVPSGDNRIVVWISGTNSSNGTINIASNSVCNYPSSNSIYSTTPPAPGYTKRVYIPRYLIGNDDILNIKIVGHNLTGDLYTYNE